MGKLNLSFELCHLVFDAQFTAEKIEEEIAYFEKHSTFERTYGWAWLLKLQVKISVKERLITIGTRKNLINLPLKMKQPGQKS